MVNPTAGRLNLASSDSPHALRVISPVNDALADSSFALPGLFDEFTLQQPAPHRRLTPIIKWAGGKEQELKYITPNLPKHIVRYFEPFVGGGAVYTSIDSEQYYINDKSEELISLYSSIGGPHNYEFFNAVEEIIHNWDILTKIVSSHSRFFAEVYKNYSNGITNQIELERKLLKFIDENSTHFNRMFSETFNFNKPNFIRELQVNAVRKLKRMKEIERIRYTLPDSDILDNIETALKSAFYMHFRHIYNHVDKYNVSNAVRSAIFLFIRNFAYSGMFRYNSAGHFNVPYGGIGYNRKNFQKKVDYLKSHDLGQLLGRTSIENLDFEDFLKKHRPGAEDFVFLDPPYDSEFSTYAQNEFTCSDQARLARFMIEECKSNWMLVIKNTDLISSLYVNKGLNIQPFEKTYLVSFMNRNDRNTEHLLITNY